MYDGSEEQLIPFLTKFDVRRQHKGWEPATYATINRKCYDSITHFTFITVTNIEAYMIQWPWSS
jgi:hypothetical protein